MASVRAFAFARDFEAEPETASEAVPRAPAADPRTLPSISEIELEKQRREAFEAGKRQGREEGETAAAEQIKAERDSRLLETLETMVEHMPDAARELERVIADIETRSTRLVLVLIKRLAHHVSERNAAAEADRLVRQTLAQFRDAPQLKARAGEAIAEPLRRLLDQNEDDLTRITVETAAALPPHAVDLRWAHGGVSYDAAAAAEEIARLVERAADTLAPKSPADPQEEAV